MAAAGRACRGGGPARPGVTEDDVTDKGRRVLVTGGAGFIGSHLVAALLARGHHVTVIDDLSSGRADRVPAAARFIHADLRAPGLLEDVLTGQARVYHLAARVSVQDCIGDWFGSHGVNLGATMQLMDRATAAGNVPVIYASSAAVYGDHSGHLCIEDRSLPAPISPYGADKLACEHQARAFAALHGLPSTGLRFFNVYGPGQDAASPYAGVIARFLDNRRAHSASTIFGDGAQSRDFVHVSDVVRALIAAADRQDRTARVFNVCTGKATSLIQLLQIIDRASGQAAIAPVHHAARGGDIRHSAGSPDAAAAALGFDARITLESGLAGMIAPQPATGANGSSG